MKYVRVYDANHKHTVEDGWVRSAYTSTTTIPGLRDDMADGEKRFCYAVFNIGFGVIGTLRLVTLQAVVPYIAVKENGVVRLYQLNSAGTSYNRGYTAAYCDFNQKFDFRANFAISQTSQNSFQVSLRIPDGLEILTNRNLLEVYINFPIK